MKLKSDWLKINKKKRVHLRLGPWTYVIRFDRSNIKTRIWFDLHFTRNSNIISGKIWNCSIKKSKEKKMLCRKKWPVIHFINIFELKLHRHLEQCEKKKCSKSNKKKFESIWQNQILIFFHRSIVFRWHPTLALQLVIKHYKVYDFRSMKMWSKRYICLKTKKLITSNW